MSNGRLIAFRVSDEERQLLTLAESISGRRRGDIMREFINRSLRSYVKAELGKRKVMPPQFPVDRRKFNTGRKTNAKRDNSPAGTKPTGANTTTKEPARD